MRSDCNTRRQQRHTLVGVGGLLHPETSYITDYMLHRASSHRSGVKEIYGDPVRLIRDITAPLSDLLLTQSDECLGNPSFLPQQALIVS